MGTARIAIDIGGTFTDVVACDAEGHLNAAKIPTLVDDPVASFAAGLAAVATAPGKPGAAPCAVLYGTTIATNALLTHRLGRIALIVTAGFREILETSGVHDEDHHEPAPGPILRHRLVPLEYVHEVRERIERDGRVRTALDPGEVADIAQRIAASNIDVVAVALLHSYCNAAHEREVSALLRDAVPRLTVVLSSDVLPELREYERTVTTCLNAALHATLHAHLGAIHQRTPAPLYLMRSSGGLSPAANVLPAPLTTVLSGPSAAVVGTTALARRLGIDAAISLDIGGTSTDVALIDGGTYTLTTSAEIAGYPLKTPAIDLLTIGAGGGSVAWLGTDQRWHVGPASAGAHPGPACYGRGGDAATLTDAHYVLGRLPHALLGGVLPLDADRAHTALERFGSARKLDAVRTALGLLRIASHAMCGAIRRVTVLRGHDPARCALFALGGAGPLHAAELAELLGITTVIVPVHPGLAAAAGLLAADLREDAVHTLPQRERALDVAATATQFAGLEARVRERLGAGAIAAAPPQIERAADLRYLGMSTEFTVPVAGGAVTEATLRAAIEAFHTRYEAFSGHAYRGREEVEIVNLRVTARQPQSEVPLRPWQPERPSAASHTERRVHFMEGTDFVTTPVYARDTLPSGSALEGPAVVEQLDATILVPPGWRLRIDHWGNALVQSVRQSRCASLTD